MISKNIFVSDLSQEAQNTLATLLKAKLLKLGLSTEEYAKAFSDAMAGRLSDLEDTINIDRVLSKMEESFSKRNIGILNEKLTLKEEYSPQEILDRTDELFLAYQNLRSAIYVYETSVEGIEELERNAQLARVELEEYFDSRLSGVIDDTQEYFATEEEEEE